MLSDLHLVNHVIPALLWNVKNALCKRSLSSSSLDIPTKIISLSNERHLSDNPEPRWRSLFLEDLELTSHDCISVPACRTWGVFCVNMCQETCVLMYLQERDQVRLRRRLQLRLQTTGELLGIDLCVLRSDVQMDYSMYSEGPDDNWISTFACH